jgi:uncharacterized protein YdeI (YjbR/CyaY-like superfamily)
VSIPTRTRPLGPIKTCTAADRAGWRAWLKKHHKTDTEVWLIYHKRHTGKPRVSYNDAVEEALCFGWIDSIIRRIDAGRYAQKFTPRRSTSKWSALNKKRAAKLIKEGKMTEAGLAKLTYSGSGDDYGRPSRWRTDRPAIPPYLMQELTTNRKAHEYFRTLAPSYRRNYILWISAAKREETRKKRLKEAMRLLSQRRKLGLK